MIRLYCAVDDVLPLYVVSCTEKMMGENTQNADSRSFPRMCV